MVMRTKLNLLSKVEPWYVLQDKNIPASDSLVISSNSKITKYDSRYNIFSTIM